MKYCRDGWPEKANLKGPIKLYQSVAGELTVKNGLLMRGCRIVIPSSMRMDILEKLHTGNLGIVRCRQRANQSVWWRGLARQLQECVENCKVCRKQSRNPAEPLMATELPSLPWQKVTTDLLDYKGHQYLVVTDYYSRYVELAKLTTTSTSGDIINHLKSIFGRHGITECLVCDNGPQYSSHVFAEFAREYGFTPITSSPRYPQGNGHAERAVQTVKSLLKKCNGDPYLSLLTYRATPLEHGFSPSELLMGRRLRTTVPISPEQLKPAIPDFNRVKAKDDMIKDRQKRNFDQHHGARELTPLKSGDKIWLSDFETEGTVKNQVETRSYTVSTPRGELRRSRRHLKSLPDESQETLDCEPDPVLPDADNTLETATTPAHALTESPIHDSMRTTRSGRIIKTPQRFKE
ncbi:uncharacterized protein K02A2.6 isoform X1 [Nematostella vectensis]|uniref:uncharacterized protein K02A2.6 isoform X1 n=1 Tax=Nematostella vectensis TaxID=45351 RepID=UPI0020778DE9|nr:uncharacterized protein K02A2.6 isoform X1 [Nematostella vectensis]XP_032217922.2 uncharacterized protein K02A2.6 isoform X1 [Nematostella vectensis]XP_048590353.1 uncharacterized protein K02A2.6 isoform X1 [Nematostella vectensis]